MEVGTDRVGGDHVGEARQHPRRRHRVAPEDDEADQVHQHERVAQRPVQVPAPPPQPPQQRQREHPVGVVVVRRQHGAERVVVSEPAIERQLGVQVQHSLHVQHAARVGERGVQPQMREVGNRVVHPRQPRHGQQLDPPACARRARGTRCQTSARGTALALAAYRDRDRQALDLIFTRGEHPLPRRADAADRTPCGRGRIAARSWPAARAGRRARAPGAIGSYAPTARRPRS